MAERAARDPEIRRRAQREFWRAKYLEDPHLFGTEER